MPLISVEEACPQRGVPSGGLLAGAAAPTGIASCTPTPALPLVDRPCAPWGLCPRPGWPRSSASRFCDSGVPLCSVSGLLHVTKGHYWMGTESSELLPGEGASLSPGDSKGPRPTVFSLGRVLRAGRAGRGFSLEVGPPGFQSHCCLSFAV